MASPKVIVRKDGVEKEIPKIAWERLGTSTDGWEYVRNADENDKVIPSSEKGKVKKDVSEYIPAEVKSMKTMQQQKPEFKTDPQGNKEKLNPAGEPGTSNTNSSGNVKTGADLTASEKEKADTKTEEKPKGKPGRKPGSTTSKKAAHA